jgi:hypothetical protein
MRGHCSNADYETTPLVRALVWSREQASNSLRELKVWAGNCNVVDYASTDYFREHLGMEACCHNLDELLCTSTLAQELTIYPHSWCCLTKLLDIKLESLAIFSRLKILDIRGNQFPSIILSDLKQLRQIKILRVTGVVLLPVPPDPRLPLLKTLQEIYLKNAPTEWMSGHVFMNLATLSIVIPPYEVGHQEFYFNAGLGQNTFPYLCTIRLLQTRRNLIFFPKKGMGSPKKLDQLVHMIWGAAEVCKTEYKEDNFHIFCAEALSS